MQEKEAVWLLYTDSTRGVLPTVRNANRHPVARMRLLESASTWFDGEWEVFSPEEKSISVEIQGAGSKVDSWKARVGLVDFRNQKRFSEITVSVKMDNASGAINGRYELLPRCGTACGGLHIRRSGGNGMPMFFFLESDRCGLREHDSFVFSKDCRRIGYNEYVDSPLQLDSSFKLEDVEAGSKSWQAKSFGQWALLRGLELVASEDSKSATITVPVEAYRPQIILKEGAWKNPSTIVSCRIPWAESGGLRGHCDFVGSGGFVDVNLMKGKEALADLSFASNRWPLPNSFQRWLKLDASSLPRKNGDEIVDEICAPRPPGIKWTPTMQGKQKKFRPLEDGQDAARYEQAIKDRPKP
ncbi:MAG: hypothetical protein AAGJ35_14830, partial [Myxococcota bacterium]